MAETDKLFKKEVDRWVKDLKKEVEVIKPISKLVGEHDNNIDFNYELIMELKEELQKLKEEIQALRMVQLLHLRTDVKRGG